MTTDLSHLYPQHDPPTETDLGDESKEFPSAKSGYSTAYWVAAGAGVLIATGAAAFTSFKGAPEPPQSLAHAIPALGTESEAVEQAIFGDEAPELEASDETEGTEAEAPASPSDPVSAAAPAADEAAGDSDDTAVAAKAAVPATVDELVPASAGAFYVQLASYRSKETAEAHAQTLAGRGFSAQSVAYGGPEAGWWHAVRLGPFSDRFAAEKSRFDLDLADRRAGYVLPRSNGKFHVQVASFAEREEAEQVAKSFSAQGHATKVTRVRMSGSYWHCVRIGPFDTREEAVAYKALVADVPGSQSTVIPFPPPPAR